MLYLFIGAENLIPPLHKGDYSVFKPGPCLVHFSLDQSLTITNN